MISKVDLDGTTYKAIVNLSSCNRQLRNLLFSSVFRTIKLGESAVSRTRSYQKKMEWMLKSSSRVLATAQYVYSCFLSLFSLLTHLFLHQTCHDLRLLTQKLPQSQ